jgi:hypothetical protein
MRSIDTSAARMAALADTLKTLSPVLVALRAKHGVRITRLALEAALEDFRHQDARARDARAARLGIANDREGA